MDGSSLARGFGEAIVGLIVIAAVGGMIVGVGLWIAVPWLFHHLSITIS